MLTDPDSPFDEWQIEVRAKDIGSARAQCEAFIAPSPLVELLNVTPSTKTPNKNGEVKFVCWYRREVQNDDSRDR
jgi:hypothetical protein